MNPDTAIAALKGHIGYSTKGCWGLPAVGAASGRQTCLRMGRSSFRVKRAVLLDQCSNLMCRQELPPNAQSEIDRVA